MAKCPRCGSEFPDNVRYCMSCGAVLLLQGTKNVPEPMNVKEKGKKGNRQSTARKPTGKKRRIAMPVAAIICMLVIVIAALRVFVFPKGGYAFDFDAYQCLEEPLEELYQDGFSDAASGQYEAAVLAALPKGVDIDRVDVSTDTLLSSSQELRDLVESVTTDESDSPLSFYVDLNSSVDEIGNDMLAKIESEMRSLGVDKDVGTGYKIELKVNVDTCKDTPLIKDDQNKVFDVKDIGVYTIEIGDRWYLWPLQEK